jgi:hypothetical protein
MIILPFYLLIDYVCDILNLYRYLRQLSVVFLLAGLACLAYVAKADPAAEPEPEALADPAAEALAYPGSSSSSGGK